MIRDYLPIGSVVLLKDGVKPVMIYGYKQIGVEDEEQIEYDYIAVLYPEGNISPEFQYMFNHKDIETVLFKGYESKEKEEFLDKIAEAYGE